LIHYEQYDQSSQWDDGQKSASGRYKIAEELSGQHEHRIHGEEKDDVRKDIY
jgi:hypothetical protein